MKIDPPPKSGSTNSRRAFWSEAVSAVLSARKTGGRFVSTDEHEGKGTVINISDTSMRSGGGGGGGLGACCGPDGICYITSRFTCEGDGGEYKGDGTNCEGRDCSGACCHDDGSCTDGVNITECVESGGTWQGSETNCDSPEVNCSCVCPSTVTINCTLTAGSYTDPISGCVIHFAGTSFTAVLTIVTCAGGCFCTTFPSFDDLVSMDCDCSGPGGCNNSSGGNTDSTTQRTVSLSIAEDCTFSVATGFIIGRCSLSPGSCFGPLQTGGGIGTVGEDATFINSYPDFTITTEVIW